MRELFHGYVILIFIEFTLFKKKIIEKPSVSFHVKILEWTLYPTDKRQKLPPVTCALSAYAQQGILTLLLSLMQHGDRETRACQGIV